MALQGQVVPEGRRRSGTTEGQATVDARGWQGWGWAQPIQWVAGQNTEAATSCGWVCRGMGTASQKTDGSQMRATFPAPKQGAASRAEKAGDQPGWQIVREARRVEDEGAATGQRRTAFLLVTVRRGVLRSYQHLNN